MSFSTQRVTRPPALPLEVDRLLDNLVTSLDLARSMQMTMLERLIEMSLVELGQTIAAHEKSVRDRGLN